METGASWFEKDCIYVAGNSYHFPHSTKHHQMGLYRHLLIYPTFEASKKNCTLVNLAKLVGMFASRFILENYLMLILNFLIWIYWILLSNFWYVRISFTLQCHLMWGCCNLRCNRGNHPPNKAWKCANIPNAWSRVPPSWLCNLCFRSYCWLC